MGEDVENDYLNDDKIGRIMDKLSKYGLNNLGERVRSLKLLRSVTSEMLLMWDRGLHSYAMVQTTVSKGCDYLGRIPANVKFLSEEALDDGSYLSYIYPSGKLRKRLQFHPYV